MTERMVARASGIHARGRLVEDDDLGPPDERQREPEPLAFATRQPSVARVRHRPQSDQVEQLVGVARVGVEPAVLPERLARPRPRVDAAVLEHQPDPCPQRRTARRRIQPEHTGPSAVGAAIALDDLDRGRLARAVGTEQGDELAGRHRQRHAVEDGPLAVALDQPVDDDRRVAGAHGAIVAYWRSKSASVSSPTWIERMTPARSTK